MSSHQSHSSDEDEFYDAEDTTPCKQHRKTDSQPKIEVDKVLIKEETNKNESRATSIPESKKPEELIKDAVDLTPEKNVIHGRRKFRELRQCMQTEDEDCGPSVNSTPDSQTSSAEGVFPISAKTAHPFRIIEHDTMSLQSLTSLGRIGRILGGTDTGAISINRDYHIIGTHTNPNLEAQEIAKMTINENQSSENTLVTLQEPDVIASTKANSLKHSKLGGSEQSIVTMSKLSTDTDFVMQPPQLPIAPPRKKKKSKVSANFSLGSPVDEQVPFTIEPVCKTSFTEKPPPLQNLNIEPPSLRDILDSNILPLPSPASTIESLTRELQHSLDLNNANVYDSKGALGASKGLNENISEDQDTIAPSSLFSSTIKQNRSESSSRSSTIKSVQSQHSGSSTIEIDEDPLKKIRKFPFSIANSLDIRSATKGQYVVKPQDDHNSKALGPLNDGLERLFDTTDSNCYGMICPSSIGHSSLGATHRNLYESEKFCRERRKSAGDEDLLKQLNMIVRTRTDSGKQLTDMEILEQVTVLNLDTGERVPLSIAEDKLPQCINPLSLHIMRLTSEYVSNSSIFDDDKHRESDDDGVSVGVGSGTGSEAVGIGGVRGNITTEGTDEQASGAIRRKTAKIKRFFGTTVKKTMDKAKSIAQEVTHARHREDVADIIDEVRGEQNIKLKASNSHKGPYDFDGSIRHVQEFSDHAGPIWCMKFSQCGRLLATAGQDKILRIWVIKDAYTFFQDMRTKYNADQKSSPTPSQESLVSHHSIPPVEDINNSAPQNDSPSTPFMQRPFCTYSGHTSDLLDLSWSKNYFILSSSMDKTVRLWHISRKECLCCFQHIDFVTAIVFHPKDDRYFLSGSLDGKLRLWNIPDKKVAVWNEVDGQAKLITAANFCQNGKFAVVGSYDGRCIFYTTDQLKYHTQIDVRSTRGKNSTGRKISGIEPMPGEDKILVTSNDSRIRLYDLRDLSLSCKYKGYVNTSSQIKASFSHDGKYIVSGSENQCIYIWKTHHDYSKFTSVRRDRNDFWEGIKAHNALVTCAVFAPNPDNIIKMIDEREKAAKGQTAADDADKEEDPVVEQHTKGCGGHVLVSADFGGCIKVFLNKTKPKHSSLPASALA